MSYTDGLAAFNLEMPPRVPHTEYSAETHWELVRSVTGVSVSSGSPESERQKAVNAFRKAWNYDFVWNILIHNQVFDGKYTRMGHASYAADAVDFDSRVSQLYQDPEEALKFDPWEWYGPRDRAQLVADFDADWANQQLATPDSVTTTGIYVTLMSGLIEVFGWDTMLCAAGIDPRGFGAVADRYSSWIQQYFDALASYKAPLVKVHDDIVWTDGAFFDPAWYRAYIFPNYKKFFAPLLAAGKKILYTSDGNYTEFIDDIAATGVHGFVLEPTTDMRFIAEHYGKTHSFIGNADTRILLSGTRQDIYNEVKRCMDIGKSCPGFFMAVGNHIPANTPVDNVLYYNEVYEKLGRR